jgi:enoyl-[acyl-carrier-protein] reductase (NADH)
MVTADDIAATALFLCSPAGRNISGQALSICGDVQTLS